LTLDGLTGVDPVKEEGESKRFFVVVVFSWKVKKKVLRKH
jgi:hypothetical protein